MIVDMNNHDYSDLDAEIIDVTPRPKSGGKLTKWFLLALLLFFVGMWRGVSVYTESLWFDSIGFATRFWYVLELGWALFAVFGILTFGILRGGFYWLERLFGLDKIAPRRLIINKQPVDVNPSRFLKLIGWIVSGIVAVASALSLSSDWQMWALYLHRTTTSTGDAIFGKPLEFYLFTLPVYQEIAGWLTTLAIILLVAAIVHAVLSAVPKQTVTEEKPRPAR